MALVLAPHCLIAITWLSCLNMHSPLYSDWASLQIRTENLIFVTKQDYQTNPKQNFPMRKNYKQTLGCVWLCKTHTYLTRTEKRPDTMRPECLISGHWSMLPTDPTQIPCPIKHYTSSFGVLHSLLIDFTMEYLHSQMSNYADVWACVCIWTLCMDV